MEALEGLRTNWLPGESHSCLKPRVSVPMSEKPSAGQAEAEAEAEAEVEGFCRDTSEELTPFSAREPEDTHEAKRLIGHSSLYLSSETMSAMKKNNKKTNLIG